MSKSEPATRQDLEEMVGEVVTEILTAMSEQLDGVHQKLDQQGNTINRIENILRPTTDKVDDHEIRLRHLETKAA